MTHATRRLTLECLEERSLLSTTMPDELVSIAKYANDPSTATQWALNVISAPTAWDITTSTPIIVAIIDSGIDRTHPDLAANIWTNTREIPGNGKDDDGNGYTDDVQGYDFASRDNDPSDQNGHGTVLAGIIGAVGNNGIGVTGIAWNVKIMPLKFMDAAGNGTIASATEALNYAVNNGAKIVNLSWTGGSYNAAFAAALENARLKGVIVVAAAGNSGTNNDTSPTYPSNYALDNVIGVAATDRNDNLASFSNYGASSVEIAAPGQSIYSTALGGKYASYSGTSMAAPQVAGALALVWGLHPEWNYRQVINDVLTTADRLPSLAGKVSTGARLDVGAAVAAAKPADRLAPTVSGATFLGVSADRFDRVRLSFSEAVNAATLTGAVTITGPNGTIAVGSITAVAGSNNTQFDVTFAAQTRAGNYSIRVATTVRDTAGNALASPYTTSANLAVAGTKTYQGSTNLAIPDQGTLRTSIVISDVGTIADIQLQLDISHTYDKDLYIYLVAPDGTQIVMTNRRGGSSANYSNTIFNDAAATSIMDAAAPFAGTFRPEGKFSRFAGMSTAGTWTLVIQDMGPKDVGTLRGWNLRITTTTASTASKQDWTPTPNAETGWGEVAAKQEILAWRRNDPIPEVGNTPREDRRALDRVLYGEPLQEVAPLPEGRRPARVTWIAAETSNWSEDRDD